MVCDPDHMACVDPGRTVVGTDRGGPERNNRWSAWSKMSSTGRPARRRLAGLTPTSPAAYRWPVAPPSTGAACPRSATWRPRGWAVPVERPALTPCGVDIPRNLRRNSREQAYVPAEQPSPSQGARLPPAHAHPCRPRRSCRAAAARAARAWPSDGQSPRHDAVLPASHRLTDRDGFRRTVRQGRRAGSTTLVVHLWVDRDAATGAGAGGVRGRARPWATPSPATA